MIIPRTAGALLSRQACTACFALPSDLDLLSPAIDIISTGANAMGGLGLGLTPTLNSGLGMGTLGTLDSTLNLAVNAWSVTGAGQKLQATDLP